MIALHRAGLSYSSQISIDYSVMKRALQGGWKDGYWKSRKTRTENVEVVFRASVSPFIQSTRKHKSFVERHSGKNIFAFCHGGTMKMIHTLLGRHRPEDIENVEYFHF